MLTQSEELAILTVLDVKELPNWTVKKTFAGVLKYLRDIDRADGTDRERRVLHLRDEIDELIGAEKEKTDKAETDARVTHEELDDLRGNVQAFIYRVQDTMPIVAGALKGVLQWEDLKREIGVYQ